MLGKVYLYNGNYYYPFDIYIQRFEKLPPLFYFYKNFDFCYFSSKMIRVIKEKSLDIVEILNKVSNLTCYRLINEIFT